jgi:hypothetical protein
MLGLLPVTAEAAVFSLQSATITDIHAMQRWCFDLYKIDATLPQPDCRI